MAVNTIPVFLPMVFLVILIITMLLILQHTVLVLALSFMQSVFSIQKVIIKGLVY
jgi:hypothetical protein